MGALTGITVIECSLWAFGPFAGVMLGDLGADVIKIESPDRPDPARHVMTVAGVDNLMPDGRSAHFQSFNRNKRSLALDLKSERGKAVFKELIKGADVFIENFRPGVFNRLGLGFDVLSEVNPRLIYASASGYGFRGSEAEKAALDVVGQARSGFMWSGGAPGDPPSWNTFGVSDLVGAMHLAYGVLAALAARELQGGIGQKVEVSHLMSTMWLEYWGISVAMLKGLDDWPRFDRLHATNPLWNTYQCGDGEWLMLGIVDAERHWGAFCEAAGVPELTHDPRFDDIYKRQEHGAELVAILDRHFAQDPRAVWEARLDANDDLVYARVQRMGDLVTDPAVVANGYVIDHEHRHYGTVKTLSHPVTLSRTPASIVRDAPELGEHSAAILTERLGYTDDDIAELVVEGVLR